MTAAPSLAESDDMHEAFFLPRHCYTDEAALDTERRTVFASGWVGVGFTADVPTPGTVAPAGVAGRSLILSRDRQGEIHLFDNVCPHRGYPLVDRCEQAATLRCPYHRWAFDLEGKATSAPLFDRTTAPASGSIPGLIHVRHAVWGGVVFADFSGQALPLDATMAPLSQRWAEYEVSDLPRFSTYDYQVPCNWKLAIENFLDYYHLPFVHRQVGSRESCCNFMELELSGEIFGAHYPTGAADKNPKMDSPLPAFPALTERQRVSQDIFCVFPNVLVFVEPNWYQVLMIDPVGPQQTRERFALFCSPDGTGSEYADSRAQVEAASRFINEQDLKVLEALQRAKRDRHGSPLVGNRNWDRTCSVFLARIDQATAQSVEPAWRPGPADGRTAGG